MKFVQKLINERFARRAARCMQIVFYFLIGFLSLCTVLSFMGRQTLLGFYLTFTGSYTVLTPVLLMTFLLLWTAPMLPLVWTVDKA